MHKYKVGDKVLIAKKVAMPFVGWNSAMSQYLLNEARIVKATVPNSNVDTTKDHNMSRRRLLVWTVLYVLLFLGSIFGVCVASVMIMLFQTLMWIILLAINAISLAFSGLKLWDMYLHSDDTPHTRVVSDEECIRIAADREAEEFFAELQTDNQKERDV